MLRDKNPGLKEHSHFPLASFHSADPVKKPARRAFLRSWYFPGSFLFPNLRPNNIPAYGLIFAFPKPGNIVATIIEKKISGFIKFRTKCKEQHPF